MSSGRRGYIWGQIGTSGEKWNTFSGSAKHLSPCLARVVDEDRLLLGEEVQAFFRHLALADAGGLDSAERQLRLPSDGGLVDVHHPALDVLDEAHHLVHVPGEDRGREAERDGVRHADRLLEVFRRRDREHRPEYLLLEDAHPGFDAVEDRGLDEIAVLQSLGPPASGEELRPFGFRDLDVLYVGLELAFVDGGAHVDVLVETVAHADLPRVLDEALDQSVFRVLESDHPRGPGAALAGRAEGT